MTRIEHVSLRKLQVEAVGISQQAGVHSDAADLKAILMSIVRIHEAKLLMDCLC